MKICPLCGKENKKRAVICSSCGFNFSGTGHIPGGRRTRAPAKEKKAGKILRIAAGCFAAMLIIVGALFFVHDLRTMKHHGDFDPIIGISGGDILLYDLQRPAAKPLKIAEAEDETENADKYRKVYLTGDRSTLVFSNSFEYYDDFFSVECDVYAYDLEALPYFPKTVLREVADWTVSENGDIYTFEKHLGGKMWLYQKLNGEDVPVTDKYKVYSVSADGKDLIYSGKSKKLNSEISGGRENVRTFAVKDLTDAGKKGSLSFALNGNELVVALPEDINTDEALLAVTEKGSALITDEAEGKAFLLRGSRFVPLSEEGVSFIIPDYPEGETNVVNYDFSALPAE